MSGPSTPISPGSHSRGVMYKQGIITAVEGNIAYVRTTLTDTIPVRRDIMRSKGRLPEVGETWFITREFGNWTFSLIVVGGEKSNLVPQGDVVGLTEDLEDINERLNHKDDQVDLLSRYVYNWASLPEAALFANSMESLSLFSAVHSVAVATAGRYIGFGPAPGEYPLTGVRLYVSAAVVGSTIQVGLYRGTVANMPLIATATINSGSIGMKAANWSSVQGTISGQYTAVGLATTASSTLAVQGIDSAVISGAPSAQVAALGATTLVNPLVMGPTTPHTVTSGRHWVGMY